MSRADANAPNMALTSWKGSVVRKQDIYIAKNYLKQEEIETLNRLTTLFLDSAELRVKERKDLTLDYWRNNVDALLSFQNKDLLKGSGAISNTQMKAKVEREYEAFNLRRKELALMEEEQRELTELRQIEQSIVKRPQSDEL